MADWKTRDEMLSYLKTALATKAGVAVGNIIERANFLDVNEAAVGKISTETTRDCPLIRGRMVFLVDKGTPILEEVSIGIMKNRTTARYILDGADRVAQSLFGAAPAETLEAKVVKDMPKDTWFMGIESGTTDACIIRAIDVKAVPSVEVKYAVKLEAGVPTYKLMG